MGDRPDFGRSVFLCSKPLQVLNCASIVREYAIDDARLHVLGSSIADVAGFREFVASTDYAAVFSSISWNHDLAAAIAELDARDYDSLFIEDDRVSHYRRIISYRTERLVLFEEGIGTYRTSAENSLRGLRRLKWKVLCATAGCGWDFGGGRRTDLVMVSRPDVFRRLNPELGHKAIGFPGLVDELGRERAQWRRTVLGALGDPSGSLGRVALVLARWGTTPSDVLDLVGGDVDVDVVFYKPHPHDGAVVDHPGVVNISAAWIPAEAFVDVLAEISSHLTVYHHSSSLAFYTRGVHDGVDDVDLLSSQQLRDVLEATGQSPGTLDLDA